MSKNIKLIVEIPVNQLKVREDDQGRKWINLPYIVEGKVEGLKVKTFTVKGGRIILAAGDQPAKAKTASIDPEIADLIG